MPTGQTEGDEKEDIGNHIFEIDISIDHNRLCKAKTAHDSVLGKIAAPVAKKALTFTEAPHLDTKAPFAKLDEVAKSVDRDVSTILAGQIKDPVLGTARSCTRRRISPDVKSTEIQQSKGLLRIRQKLDRLFLQRTNWRTITML